MQVENMKKNIKIIVVTLIVLIISFFTYEIVLRTNQKRIIANSIQTIPNFSFTKLNNDTFSNNNLEKNKAIVFINFNSKCHFCQNEAKSIQENIDALKEVQFLFISSEPIDSIKNFAMEYKLIKYRHIIFLFDKNDTFSTIFDTNTIPSSLIYNKKQKLIKKNKGQLMASRILKDLNLNE